MANYCTLLSVLFPVGAAGNVALAMALYRQFADELEEAGGWIGFTAEADDEPGGADLWLHSDADSDVEHVIAFALRCAEAFDLKGLWRFCWALTCSKPRLDGYGGGAQLLELGRRRSLDWLDCEHWLSACVAGPGQPRTAAEAILFPAVAAQGWTEAAQARELLAFIDAEIAADPGAADRLRVALAERVAKENTMLCRECGEPMFIEDNGVSHHEGGGLDGIDYGRDADHVAVAEVEPQS